MIWRENNNFKITVLNLKSDNWNYQFKIINCPSKIPSDSVNFKSKLIPKEYKDYNKS